MERQITLIALFAALIAALGLVPPIPLPWGVPITAQSLGVMLCGVVLGARAGGLAALLFLVLVAVGLPLLSGGRGGLGAFQAPTVGFTLGFVPAAIVTGLIAQWLRERDAFWGSLIAALVGGVVALYVCGVAGMAIVLDKTPFEALLLTAWYIPGDMIKAGIAGFVGQTVWRARPELMLARNG